MPKRRTIAICQEGYYYLFVLSFIVGGALLRQVNLLIILAGIMIGLLIFNWRFVTTSLTQIKVRRKLPTYVCAGDPFNVGLVAENNRTWLDSWAFVLDDEVQEPDVLGDEAQTSRPKLMIPHVPTQDETWGEYRCVFHRRGRYRFGAITVTTRFPLGLVIGRRIFEFDEELIVYPKLGHLTPNWRQAVESKATGDQRAQAKRGVVEGDHYGLRDWRAGDNQRWIHWRASAKLNELKVREFENHHSHELTLLLDLWSADPGENAMSDTIEFAVGFASTIVVDSCQQGARRVTFGATGETDCFMSAPASTSLMHEALEELSEIQARHINRLPELLSRTVSETPRGSKIIVLSTRPANLAQLVEQSDIPSSELDSLAQRTIWIDVVGMDCSNLFELAASPTE